MYLLNAFSIQMLDNLNCTVKFTEIKAPTKQELQKMDSAIGHYDTAKILDVDIKRINVILKSGDSAIVAQFIGGRLPEGTTILPNDFSLKFIKLEVL